MTLIYRLINPVDGETFYIGRTSTTLKKRLTAHLKESRSAKNPKALKITEIVALGHEPEIIELFRLIDPTLEEAEECEQAWIDFYQLSNQLTNVKPAAAGGIGCGDGIRYEWTPEVLARLGKAPDSEIAKDMGCSQTAVADQRIKLRIPKFTDSKWTLETIARLGKEPDSTIAKDLDCWFSVVAVKRQKLGIPAYKSSDRWTSEVVARLGKEPDTKIAKDLGLHPQAVLKYRQEHGIPACPRSYYKIEKTAPTWNKTKLPESVVRKLGTMTDADLAAISGFTHRVIHGARTRLNIPSYAEAIGNPTQFKQGQPHPRWSKLNNSSQPH
jgi:hypothetical protein